MGKKQKERGNLLITINATNERILILGYRGEKNVRKVIFDISELKATYGDGEVSLTNLRVGEYIPYNVTNCKISDDGSSLEWLISDTDTGKYGKYGSCQLTYTVNNAVAMTKTWQTEVYKSLTPTGKAPEPYYSWLTDVKETAKAIEDKVAETEDFVIGIGKAIEGIPEQIEHINNSVTSAGEYSLTASYYNACAEIAKADAEKHALSAQEAAEEIKNTVVGANQITPTAEGSYIVLSDSADAPIIGAKIYGNESTKDPSLIIQNEDTSQIQAIGFMGYTLRGVRDPKGNWFARDEIVCNGKTVKLIQNISDAIVEDGTKAYRDYGTSCVIDTKINFRRLKDSSPTLCCVCTHNSSGIGFANAYDVSNSKVSFRYSDFGVTNLDEFKALLTQANANGTPFTWYAPIETPIETDITDTEVGQALLSLRTYYPTTTVICDTDAAITYAADTKNYIDNKFNELAAAIVAQ